MKSAALPIPMLVASSIGSAVECPLLLEPEEIRADTPVTANWTSVLGCSSEPVVELSGSVVTVDFNLDYCPGVLPPGFRGNNRALIGNLRPGAYTLIAIGQTRSVQLNSKCCRSRYQA